MDFSNVKTRDGRKVTIISTTARGKFPVLGYIEECNPDDLVTWTLEGKFLAEDVYDNPNDLLEQSHTLETWVVLFKSEVINSFSSYTFNTEEDAKRYAEESRVGYDYEIIALHDLVKE